MFSATDTSGQDRTIPIGIHRVHASKCHQKIIVFGIAVANHFHIDLRSPNAVTLEFVFGN
jgi:hypothetical protein